MILAQLKCFVKLILAFLQPPLQILLCHRVRFEISGGTRIYTASYYLYPLSTPVTAFSSRIVIPKGQIGLIYILLPYINTLILDIILKLLLHIPYNLLFVG